jgi:hypothetical protein
LKLDENMMGTSKSNIFFRCDGYLGLAHCNNEKSSFGEPQNKYIVVSSFGLLARVQNLRGQGIYGDKLRITLVK